MEIELTDKPYFNFQEMAKLLGKNKGTISKWRKKGGVFSYDTDPATGEYRVQASEIQRLLDVQKSTGGKKATKKATVKSNTATGTNKQALVELESQLLENKHENELLQKDLVAKNDKVTSLESQLTRSQDGEDRLSKQVAQLTETVTTHTHLLQDLRTQKPEESSNDNFLKRAGGYAMTAMVTAVIIGAGVLAYQNGFFSLSGLADALAGMETAAGE